MRILLVFASFVAGLHATALLGVAAHRLKFPLGGTAQPKSVKIGSNVVAFTEPSNVRMSLALLAVQQNLQALALSKPAIVEFQSGNHTRVASPDALRILLPGLPSSKAATPHGAEDKTSNVGLLTYLDSLPSQDANGIMEIP